MMAEALISSLGPLGRGNEELMDVTGLSFVRLSMAHPTLPLGELKGSMDALGLSYDEVLLLDGIVILRSDPDGLARAVRRTAFSKECGQVLYIGEPEEIAEGVARAAKGLRGLHRVDIDAVKGLTGGAEAEAILRDVINGLREAGVELGLNAHRRVKAYVTDNIVVVGLVTGQRDMGDLDVRSPPRKPYWRSGELNVPLSRAMVNLSRLPPGGSFLDPFCGTGTLAIEASLLGASRPICLDIDSRAVGGALANARAASVDVGVVQENSEHIPLRPLSVDSIATDPPYGRSTVMSRDYEGLVISFLEEAERVLRPGGYVIYAGPSDLRPARLAARSGLRVVEVYDQFVHGGLTRQVVVAKKPLA